MATDSLSSSTACSNPDPWSSLQRQALDLAATLRSLASSPSPEILDACSAYTAVADEIGRWASQRGTAWTSRRLPPTLSPSQLQAFGNLLRDKRNLAGFSRVQLARKAKLSDATIKFIETARHPPSRATLLRLVGVPELGLRWTDTPGSFADTVPPCLSESDAPSLAAETHRLDSRLSLQVVFDVVLLLDELYRGQYRVEVTAHGARRICSFCDAHSEAWAVDADCAARLPLLHAACCAGRLVELLFQQHPVLAELAQEQRRLLRTPMALALDACRRASQPERFYCCRSGREVAALLTRLATLPPTLHKQGASELLLWALGLSPCPVESESGKFSEACARRIVEMFRAERIDPESTDFRLRGAVAAAAWLVEPDASELAAPSQSEFEALFFPDAGSHV